MGREPRELFGVSRRSNVFAVGEVMDDMQHTHVESTDAPPLGELACLTQIAKVVLEGPVRATDRNRTGAFQRRGVRDRRSLLYAHAWAVRSVDWQLAKQV